MPFTLYLNGHSQSYDDIDIGSIAVQIQSATGSGSGFYIEDTSKHFIYFVTACHVIIDPKTNLLFSDSIMIISYKKNSQRDNRDSFKISLVSAYKMGMLKYDIKKDVALIMFGISNNTAVKYLPFVNKLIKTSTYLNTFEIHDIKKLRI